MMGGFRMLAGMLVRGAVTAARSAAFLTCPQVDPLRADFDAIFTFAFPGVFYVCDGTDMGTRRVSHCSLPLMKFGQSQAL